MSLRIDTAELIAGSLVIGNTGLGVLGSAVPSLGLSGAGYLFNDLNLPAENNDEFYGVLLTTPVAGSFYAWEDSSFSLASAPDGTYTFTYRGFKNGVTYGTGTGTVTVGAGSASILFGSVTLDDIAPTGTIFGNAVTLTQEIQSLLAPFTSGGAHYAINEAETLSYPYIVWQRIISVPTVDLAGPADLQNTRIQVDIFSRYVSEAHAVQLSVQAAFAAWTKPNVPLSVQDMYENEVKAYRTSLDYSIWATN